MKPTFRTLGGDGKLENSHVSRISEYNGIKYFPRAFRTILKNSSHFGTRRQKRDRKKDGNYNPYVVFITHINENRKGVYLA